MISRQLIVADHSAMMGVLSEAGMCTLRRHGHAAVAGACASGLPAGNVRFVDVSERHALETASEPELATLYSAPFPARPVVMASRSEEGQTATLELRVQPDLACLRGHFPALPVVPGAVQLGWALEFGAEFLGSASSMRACLSVKFERIIQPGRSLRLLVASEVGTSMLRVEYWSALGRHSSGRIETARPDG